MYNPVNWYWIIGGSKTDAYSSKSNTLVDVSDQGYTEFLAAYAPNQIATEAELAEVLKNTVVQIPKWMWDAPSFIQPAVGEYDKGQLAAYAADAQFRKTTGGAVINGLPFATDPATMMTLNSAHMIDKQSNAFSWKLPDGSFITLDQNGVKALQACIVGFLQSCFACEDAVLAAIEAGTTTTLEQIDEAFAAISNVFTATAVSSKARHRRAA